MSDGAGGSLPNAARSSVGHAGPSAIGRELVAEHGVPPVERLLDLVRLPIVLGIPGRLAVLVEHSEDLGPSTRGEVVVDPPPLSHGSSDRDFNHPLMALMLCIAAVEYAGIALLFFHILHTISSMWKLRR